MEIAWVELALMVVTVLLGISEILAATSSIESNSVFQAVVNGLKKVKDVLGGK